ncbi:OmpA family protein [Pseudosulfitobacter sp. DSM 107133]|uniref:OmpA family protein n=1 Tax=Pseudosulfitobacter sp. DSM 107133 TaxID=2883100 RepID=UPI001F080503|nr:OmpA family protein [Pseudosulfitobacter sp. DSM 107133]UOA28545.1 Outer membrane porin F [Pseudosulfitobacter sp. DSM 107133]
MNARLAITALVVWAAAPVQALQLTLSTSARETVERNSALDRYLAPTGAFQYGVGVPTVAIEGQVRRQAWRIASAGLTTLQVLVPLRAQLKAAGYVIALDCDQSSCGGFDFRFNTEVLPAPNMRVNMRAYRFVTAIMGPTEQPDSVITLMVSTTSTAAYVQIIEAGKIVQQQGTPETVGDRPTPAIAPTDPPPPVADFDRQLLTDGHIVLGGLEFDTGTSALGKGPFASVQMLAKFLLAQPDVTIAVVGHTDSVGSQDVNIALSRQRAAAVRQRLIDAYNVDPEQVQAEGMGYLAPIASNLTAAGREQNRRVEAVLLSQR